MELSTAKPTSTKLDDGTYIVNHNISEVFQFSDTFAISLNNGRTYEIIREADFMERLDSGAYDESNFELESLETRPQPICVEVKDYHRIQREVGKYLGMELKDLPAWETESSEEEQRVKTEDSVQEKLEAQDAKQDHPTGEKA